MRLEKLRAADVMSTAVITLKDSDTVTDADAEMRLAGIRHLPVVDSHDHVVGIVSDRDILFALARNPKHPVRIGAIMSARVRTIREETSVRAATEILLENRISALPVVGDDARLVGIVTETDLLKVAHRALGGNYEPEAMD